MSSVAARRKDFARRINERAQALKDKVNPDVHVVLPFAPKAIATRARIKVDIDAEKARRQQRLIDRRQEDILRQTSIVKRVQMVVSDATGVRIQDIISCRRHQASVDARQLGMFLCREYSALSLPDIGRRFGDRDHTTVLHAVAKMKAIEQAPDGSCHQTMPATRCDMLRTVIKSMRLECQSWFLAEPPPPRISAMCQGAGA